MLKRIACFSFLIAAQVTPTLADVDVVIDDFESYVDHATLLAAWPSSDPNRPTPGAGDNGTRLTTDPNGFYGGSIVGQAAEFCGSAYDQLGIQNCGGVTSGGGTVNIWSTPFQISPSATQNIELSVDIGDDAFSSIKRLTVGLRSATPAENFIELGFWNLAASLYVPHFAYRAVLFASGSIDTNSGWSAFSVDTIEQPLAPELDSPFEVGAAFHRYNAVISLTDVTFTLDLFADGKTNDPLDPVPGVGPDGVDAMDVVGAVTGANGYNQIRFGTPSAIASSGGTDIDAAFAAFDNISLRLVDIPVGGNDGDYNLDGIVDAADYVVWRKNDGTQPGYDTWRTHFGETIGNGAAATDSASGAIPEPTSRLMLILGMLTLFFRRRAVVS